MKDVLARIANDLDARGKIELADAVDSVINKDAARPKAPLKDMDDDVKKDLLKFLHTVKTNMEDSLEALEELFRRLRYFDVADTIKELDLDKAFKELKKTQDSMDGATKSMYALSYGKKPSRDDMEQMADDFGLKRTEKPNPLDFFAALEKEEGGEEDAGAESFEDDDDLTEEDFEKFWSEDWDDQQTA